MITTTNHSSATVSTISGGDTVIDLPGNVTVVIANRQSNGTLVGAISAHRNAVIWCEDGTGGNLPTVGPAALVQGF